MRTVEYIFEPKCQIKHIANYESSVYLHLLVHELKAWFSLSWCYFAYNFQYHDFIKKQGMLYKPIFELITISEFVTIITD